MRYFDQHTHCRQSPDSTAPLRAMAEAARDHGMAMMCITDHTDMDESTTGQNAPYWPDNWPGIMAEWEGYLSDPVPGIEVRLGMELGEIHHFREVAEQAAASPLLDLVIGSLHNLRDTIDFYYLPYASDEECVRWNHLYLAELREMASEECFDVMGHIGYTARYMHRRGCCGDITAEMYREELAEIYRILIRRGKGLEVNVSGLREGHTTYPTPSALALYKELGGEIVTVGSDAHTPESAGIGVKEGFELLSSLGFRYVASYKKRKPEFIRLDG